MNLTLNPRTMVSGVGELLALREQIETTTARANALLREQIDPLTARAADVASHIVEDAAFMGGQVLRMPDYYATGVLTATLGTVYHVARYEHEHRGALTGRGDAHPIGECRSVAWCKQRAGERVRIRWTRQPNRSWFTFLGMWAFVGVDDKQTATFVALERVTSS